MVNISDYTKGQGFSRPCRILPQVYLTVQSYSFSPYSIIDQSWLSLGREAAKAFSYLKTVLSTLPILALLDFSKDFIVESNAIRNGIGAILSQEGQLVAYYSEALKCSMFHLSAYEKEMLAIVKAIRKW